MKKLTSITIAIIVLTTVFYGHDDEHILIKIPIFKKIKTKKD